jgi:DUF971 family protein
MSQVRVKDIKQVNERTLAIDWTDGRSQKFDVVDLRRECPCAVCVDERSGERLLDPASIPETIRPSTIKSVGAYAIQIRFSDGHGTGIYTFDKLRSLNR